MRASLSLGLQLLLAGPLVSAFRWYNWQNDLTCEATTHFVPDDEDDLASFVKGHPTSMIKVVGNGHGFGNMTTCVDVHATNRTSHIVSLTNLKDLHFNSDDTVTFGGGWDLIDIVPAIRDQGLSVIQLGSERVQNFIGAASTGTHGTGGSVGNIASSVVGVRVMDSSGEITVVNSTHNADLLPAFRLSLGALGIITEVTIQAQPLKYLKRTSKIIDSSENLTELFSTVYDLHQEHDRLTIYGPNLEWNESISNYTLKPHMTAMWWEETDFTGEQNCTNDYCANDCGDCAYDYVCYDELSDAISTPPAGVCNRVFYTEIEHFIPLENFVEAAADYVSLELNQPSEGYNNKEMIHALRFVKGDDTWMSPVNTYNLDNSSSGVFAVFEVDWYPTYNDFESIWFYQTLAQEYEIEFGRKYNTRAHWGKMSWFNETFAEYVYPHVNDFLAVQEKMDPNCQFVNEFLVDHLGIDRCAGTFDYEKIPSIINLKM